MSQIKVTYITWSNHMSKSRYGDFSSQHITRQKVTLAAKEKEKFDWKLKGGVLFTIYLQT